MSLEQVINSGYTTIGYGHTTNYISVLGAKNIAAFQNYTKLNRFPKPLKAVQRRG